MVIVVVVSACYGSAGLVQGYDVDDNIEPPTAAILRSSGGRVAGGHSSFPTLPALGPSLGSSGPRKRWWRPRQALVRR